uniref:poly [ADP-ribose] polymerase tankyrase-like n=1 Tax=Styela clava TaxID=7725 RepID=UPI001939B58C|nr:poly [ADP-ribose] polymerase tankyrase-like [Styela clava]
MSSSGEKVASDTEKETAAGTDGDADQETIQQEKEISPKQELEEMTTIDATAIQMEVETTDDQQELEEESDGGTRGKSRTKQADKRGAGAAAVSTRQKSKRPRRHVASSSLYYEYEVPSRVPTTPTPKKSDPSVQVATPSGMQTPELKPYFAKGEVLAVRNEDGGYYLCSCPMNIFNASKPFKIQWFDKHEEPNIYKKSYFDFLHEKAVLYSGLSLKKMDAGKFELPEVQEKKILHRLEKSLQGVEEISSDSEDEGSSSAGGYSPKKKGKSLKLSAKQVGGPERVLQDEDAPLATLTPSTKRGRKAESKKAVEKSAVTPKLGKITMGQGSARKKTTGGRYGAVSAGKSPTIRLAKPQAKMTPGSSGTPVFSPKSNSKTKKLLQITNAQDEKLGGASIVSSDTVVQYMYSPDAVSSSHPRNDQLTPNMDIEIADKDPAFDSRAARPFLPWSKLAIRAVILQDVEQLEELYKERQNAPDFMRQYRSTDVQYTALHYALLSSNQGVLQSLLHEMKRVDDHHSIETTPEVLKDPNDPENGFKGDHLSAVDISKGMKEGNYAFLKDWHLGMPNDTATALEYATFACSHGVGRDTLRLLMSHYPKLKDGTMTNLLLQSICHAAEMGHVDTTHFLISYIRKNHSESVPGGVQGSPGSLQGHGFTDLHELALSQEEPMPRLTNKEIKKRSASANGWLQPVHLAAINPDPTNIKNLFQLSRDCINAADIRGRRPIHYAAACEGTGPLEFLCTRVNFEEQDQMGMTPLMVAALAGRHRNVELILKSASKNMLHHVENVVERPDRNNYAAVHYAAQHGHANVIEVLSKYGANMDRPVSISKARATPLMLAAANGHLKTCIALVNCGASIEAPDKLQRSALIHSALNGHYPVMTYLLRKGADPNVTDSSNNSAIHYAAGYGWYHCVQLLLDANANPDVYNDRKMPPIGVALLKNHRDVANLLFEHAANIHFKDERGRTILSRLLADESLSWQLVDLIAFLLDTYKPDVNAQDVQGMAPLHNIASNSIWSRTQPRTIQIEKRAVSLYLAELLLEKGAELNMADYRGRLPLYFAVEDMNVNLIELMVRKDTHCPRSVNAVGDNILHMLAKNWDQGNMAETVFGLVNRTPQTVIELASRRNKYGLTPLLLLAKTIGEQTLPKSTESNSDTYGEEVKKIQKSLEDIACPLLEALVLAAKSDISMVVGKTRRSYRNLTDDGKSAAHYLSKAAVDKDFKVLSALLRHKPKLDVLDQLGNSPLTMAILHRNSRAVQLLLDAGAQPNFCSNNKKHKYPMAPLILATARHGPGEKSLLPAIRALLRTITDIKLVPADPRNGRTALMCAVEQEEEMDLVNALLEKQASLNERDHNGCSALHLAVNASGPNSALFDIPDMLIEKGASLTADDDSGRIPLHYAYMKIGKSESNKYNDPIELTTLLTSGMTADKIDTADKNGQTPLHAASMQGAMICCMHLVERGANINRQDSDGNSPLSLAVKSGQTSCAVMLIQKGANVNTNVITIPKDSASEIPAKKWQLKSANVLPMKSTCEPVFKVVVEKGWQGVTYVMLDRLEACGVKYAAAVEAAMRAKKYQVVLSLLRKQRDSGKLCEKNEKKQNLLHVLAMNRPSNSDVQIKVAQLLIERGVPDYTTDDYQCTPLHYAAYTKNHTLIKFFMDRNPSSVRMISFTDFKNRNAIAALLWNPVINDELTTTILKLFLEHDKGSGAINQSCNFPDISSVVGDYSVEAYFNSEEIDTVQINPIVRAIQRKAHRVLDLLLEYNVDINVQVEGLHNQTPLMVAVQQNDEYVVKKLLTHKTPVLLSSLDDEGRTVLHHTTRPLTYGYWENTNILQLLVEQGVPLTVRDRYNKLALDYALEEGSGKMSEALQAVMGLPELEWQKPMQITAEIQEENWETSQPMYEVDAGTILDRIREDELENEVERPLPQPDVLSGLRETGEIVIDPTMNRPCDVFLTAVDVQQGGVVQYNFFRIQVIHQKGRHLYLFFTRWGTIGERGSWQTSPFKTPVNAINEFAKYYKLKTGNEWRNVNNFKPQTRKYHLVAAEVQQKRGVADLEFDLRSDIASQLDQEVREAFTDLISVDSMKEALKDSTNVDPDIMPFGRLEKDRLNLGVDILNEIKDLIATTQELKLEDAQDQIRLQRALEKIQQLSTEYFRLLPPRGGLFDRVRSICDVATLNQLMKQTQRLIELEFSNKVLLGAQYRINEMNPLDYVYRSVGCRVKVMEPLSDESQYILQYLYNSAPAGTTVECIYRISRPGEAENLVSTGLGNFKMLWHGTNILNLMSILHKGLMLTEPPPIGPLLQFGKGIYMSDMASCAMQDCKKWDKEKKYLLLCQVALGHVKEIRDDMPRGEMEVANSVMAVGKNIPKPGHELILPEGGAIPLGEQIKNPDMTGVSNAYNEYVVYSQEQVCLRYLVRYSDAETSHSVSPTSTTSSTSKLPK